MNSSIRIPSFKNASGQFYLKQLFFEYADTDREFVLYTMKDEDHKGYPSLRRLYLECDDETEYLIATKYFGGWPHWKRLLNCSWFLDHLSQYREELKARQTMIRLQALNKKASEGSVPANQFLLREKTTSPVGRPTKERIHKEARELYQSSQDISEDLDRLLNEASFLKVVK